jgi:serine/threonine protein kinase
MSTLANHANENASSHAKPLRFAVIEGAEGYRIALAALVRSGWPASTVEEIDPFAQTLSGLNAGLRGKYDIVLWSGISTVPEAVQALDRINRTPNPPLLILIVRDAALTHAADFIAAGALAVLPRMRFSMVQLYRVIRVKLGIESKMPVDNAQYDIFPVAFKGEMHALEICNMRCLGKISSNDAAQVFFAERMSDKLKAVVKIDVGSPYAEITQRAQSIERYKFFPHIRSRHIPQYFDGGMTGPWTYFVIEFIPHGNLRKLLTAPLQVRRALQICDGIARGLKVLHDGEFAHLDIKPENIFFREDDTVTLIDFNISARFGNFATRTPASNGLSPGEVMGTPTYMSPEQARGDFIDGRADLYSVGVVLFEMLAGVPPFIGESTSHTIYQHMHHEVPLLPKAARELQPLIDRLLAKNAHERLANVDALIAELTGLLARV